MKGPGNRFLSQIPFAGTSFAVAVLSLVAAAHVPAAEAPSAQHLEPPALIPRPVELELKRDRFELTRGCSVVAGPGAEAVAERLAAALREPTGFPLPLAAAGTESESIVLDLDRSLAAKLGEEGYRLSVAPGRAALRAAAEAGLFYAGVTFRELLPPEALAPGPPPPAGFFAPSVEIEDGPRFAWRGLLLDVARHFMPPDSIRKLLDAMALHKLNRLQLHLTDDQGWRIEIKAYPRLTRIGSTRKESPRRGDRERGDGTPYGPFFYTQDQIRELVRHARDRGVTLVPEIEMPGHFLSALAAYPELSCTGGPFEVRTRWGVEPDILCAGNDRAIQFAKDVLGEVVDLFPGRFVHIGGDEAPRDRWKACPKCRARIQAQGLKDEAELQTWFNARIEEFLASKGRRLIGWDEILEGGITPGSAVMSWRGTAGGIDAAGSGHDVVMSPTSHCYFDYAQARGLLEPESIGGLLPLRTVYEFEPVPAELPRAARGHIIGTQGNVWTEFIWTPGEVEYFAFPRAAALAEVAWSPPADRDYLDFLSRLGPHLRRLDRMGVKYRRPDEGGGAEWPRELTLPGGGIWRRRIEVTIRNGTARDAAGAPVGIAIGKGPGEIDLAGSPAESIRVTDGKGRELLFRIQGPPAEPIEGGPVPAGSLLVIPAECPAGKTSSAFVYLDNPLAWPVPDLLPGRLGLQNGGLEGGPGEAPPGWSHDEGDGEHRALWVAESPRSGSRCLKTVVSAGAEPTWISTRQSGIGIAGGARYRLTAWVKAEDVKGSAGWYIHVGSLEIPMMISPMLDGGGGTHGWKEVSAEFTAPEDASIADLGTVLRGTGTAWFDDVSLKRLSDAGLSATAGAAGVLDVEESGAGEPWPDGGPGPGPFQGRRLPLRLVNLSGEPLAGLACVDLSAFLARRKLEAASPVVVDGTARRLTLGLHGKLLFETELPARTIKTSYAYLPRVPAAVPAPSRPELEGYAALIASKLNRVRDPSFEDGEGAPAGWSGGAAAERPAGTVMDLVEPGLFGKRCARISVPRGAKLSWTGWRQDVPVRPGKTYLLAAWLRCEGLEGDQAQVHVHFLDSSGKLTRSGGMAGAGPPIGGTTGWRLLEGLFQTPEDAAVFQVHLTMLATGTLWHDGVLLAEAIPAEAGKLERREEEAAGISTWSVNPIVKVFQEDLPPAEEPPVRISAARNEKEPLQIAVRSDRPIEGLRATVERPVHPGGFHLPVDAGAVGYVPIDRASNYYETGVPPWVRKVPVGPARSDGWPGLWPDPILPEAAFDLSARTTRPVWITVDVPPEAPAGEYASKVRLESRGKTLKEVPFTVEIRDFTLPRESGLKAIYDLRLGGRWRIPGKGEDETRRGFARFMADRRVSPDRIQPDPRIRYRDGRVTADFEEFDRAAAYWFEELKVPHTYTPEVFYLFGWGHPPAEKFGEAPYEGRHPYPDADRGKLRPAFKRAYQACLEAYWDHMKEKGWEKRCVLYISDEPYHGLPPIREQMKALCDMVHEVDRAIPIYSSTWVYVPEWKGYLDVWGIGHHGTVSPEAMVEIRKAGGRIWFTTDGQMCTDTPYCAVERLLPHYCFSYGAEAYEFWGISWLTYDPYRFGWHSFIHQSGEPGSSTWIRYPNGDGYLAYPGGPVGRDGPVTSIRLEAAREGVEDFEYLRLLRDLVARAKAAGRDAAAGERALDLARRLVTIPNAGGTSSTRILPDPDRVLEVREAVAEAIEALGKD